MRCLQTQYDNRLNFSIKLIIPFTIDETSTNFRRGVSMSIWRWIEEYVSIGRLYIKQIMNENDAYKKTVFC